MKASMIVVILLFSILIISGCSKKNVDGDATKLSELQVEACNSAQDGGSCNTKLADLGIVTKEDCCKNLNKCC
jgi:hypothetical protein